jgi:hypothetical protein
MAWRQKAPPARPIHLQGSGGGSGFRIPDQARYIHCRFERSWVVEVRAPMTESPPNPGAPGPRGKPGAHYPVQIFRIVLKQCP